MRSSSGETMKRLLLLLSPFVAPSLVAYAGSPDCGGPNSWAANMAFVHLKNDGLIQNETTDFAKTTAVRVASEKIGKDLYRQVHKVTFFDKSGHKIEVITVNDASNVECSMSGVEVFVISRDLGGLDG
jgi:hypothetical protein